MRHSSLLLLLHFCLEFFEQGPKLLGLKLQLADSRFLFCILPRCNFLLTLFFAVFADFYLNAATGKHLHMGRISASLHPRHFAILVEAELKGSYLAASGSSRLRRKRLRIERAHAT